MSQTRPAPAIHYEVCAYICTGGAVKPSPFEGWATYQQIIDRSPPSGQYVVVRKLPIRNHQGKVFAAHRPEGLYLVWDLAQSEIFDDGRHRWRSPASPVWTSRTKDGAIMKAVMCCGI